MRCLPWIVVAALGLAAPVHADEAVEPPRADRVSESPRLRTWHLALQSVDAWRNHFDVFDQPGLPPAGVDSRGKGGGMAIGHRQPVTVLRVSSINAA